MGAMVDLLESIKLEQAGSKVGMTGRVARDKVPVLLALPMILWQESVPAGDFDPEMQPVPRGAPGQGF